MPGQKPTLNIKFLLRGLAVAVPAALIGIAIGLGLIISRSPITQPPDPTPPPPTILAPRSAPPDGPVGLEEWARYQGDEAHALVGCGFMLTLPDGEVVGVTTAHSAVIGDPQHLLEQIAFVHSGQEGFVAEFDALWGPPGQPLSPNNFVIDYVLLLPNEPVAPDLVFAPDPRGGPQPGERVLLYQGLGGGRPDRHPYSGTVQSVGETTVWVLMDETFQPGRMSGSPFVSQHTGRVVGMAVAATPRRDRLLLGMNPIGTIVAHAEAAGVFPSLLEYRP